MIDALIIYDEKISSKKYKLDIDLFNNGKTSRFSTISPEKMFYEANCGKELDAKSFNFHSIGNAIYLVFNQRGNFLSHNFNCICSDWLCLS